MISGHTVEMTPNPYQTKVNERNGIIAALHLDAFHAPFSLPSPSLSGCVSMVCILIGSGLNTHTLMDRLKHPLFLFLAAVIMIGSCGCISREMPLSQEEQAQVIAFANPITDNLLDGFNQDNYQQYSRDFSSEMKQGLDEKVFEQNRALVVSKIGSYISRGDPFVTGSGEFLVVNYKADFEQEEGVDIRVIFRKGDDTHQVYGLWFNSPKLRS